MSQSDASPKPLAPIRWTGVIFALAANLLLVTVVDIAMGDRPVNLSTALALRLLAPILAGLLTAFYVQQRGGIHAFLGGMISVPLLALLIFQGNWQSALLAGILCALAGTVGELVLRRRGV